MLLWIAASLVMGCGPMPDLVRRAEKERFCPASRIVAREREDLRPHHFGCMNQRLWRTWRAEGKRWWEMAEEFWKRRLNAGDPTSVDCGDPPAEIQGDPGRARLWTELRDRELAKIDVPIRVFEITACGSRQFYGCRNEFCGALGEADPKGAR